jgi:hypothetical protein
VIESDGRASRDHAITDVFTDEAGLEDVFGVEAHAVDHWEITGECLDDQDVMVLQRSYGAWALKRLGKDRRRTAHGHCPDDRFEVGADVHIEVASGVSVGPCPICPVAVFGTIEGNASNHHVGGQDVPPHTIACKRPDCAAAVGTSHPGVVLT